MIKHWKTNNNNNVPLYH